MKFTIKNLEPFGALVEPEIENASIDDIAVEVIRKQFRQNQLILMRGFKTFEEPEDLSKYCEKWGEICVWPSGKVADLIQKENPEDHIYDNGHVPLHWDGMYRLQVPEYQFFQCLKAPLPGQGGMTTFTNTMLALDAASIKDINLWRKIIGRYHRKEEFYNSWARSPIIINHPQRNYEIIRYCEPHFKERGDLISPTETEFTGANANDLEFFHKTMHKALYNPENYYVHEWKIGDLLIADNFTLLHGREAFKTKSPRHIRRVQVLSDPPWDNPHLESYEGEIYTNKA